MGQMIVRKLDDNVIERIKKKAKLEGTSAEQVARKALTDAFKPSRDELIARMEAIRAKSKPTSGQDIIDEIRRDRDNNLGRPIFGLDDDH
jgi:plasmid stability protein